MAELNGQHRLSYLDALRGFAILGVILTHAASLAGLRGSFRNLTNTAGNGVLLFFVISACTIFLTVSKAVKREGKPWGNFYIKRFLRLFPVYWLGIILYTAVYGMASRGWKPGPELWHYPLHITLTNLLAPEAMSSVVPGGWSISCEALFYLTVPLWFLVARGWRSALLLALGGFIVGPLVVNFLAHALDPLFRNIPAAELHTYWYRSLPAQLGVFFCGIALYFLMAEQPLFVRYLRRPAANLLLLAASLALLLVESFHSVPLLQRQYVFALSFFGIALALSQIPWRLAVNGATEWIGRVSYSAYLSHFLVLKQLSLAFPNPGWSAAAYTLFLTAVSLPPTLLLSWIGFRLVEQPTTRLAKRLVKAQETRRAPSLSPA